MNWTKLYLNTPIPQIPKIYNDSFASMQRYLDILYDGSAGVLLVPVETSGKVKATRGEFVTSVVDNLVVRNQWTNLFDNTNTADFSWYSAFIGPDSSMRDASTWENLNFKYLDVNKPYYKVNNNDPLLPGRIALKSNNLSQIVQLIFDPSTSASYSILLDPCTGETYDVGAADSLSQWISFICVKNDPSFGSSWEPYKFGRDASVSGGGGGLGPGTIRTIPLFNTTITVGDSSMRFDANNNLIIDASIYQRNKLIEIYDPSLSGTLAAPIDIGGIIAGTTVNQLKGKTFEQLFSDIIFPTVLAYVSVINSLTLSGISTEINEVGTAYSPNVLATYNVGTITNGDLTIGPNLTGDASMFLFSLPDGTVDAIYTATGNTQGHTFSSYNIAFGANTWEVFINYYEGTGSYYDNKGNALSNLDASRNEGIMIDLSNTVTGRRYAWRGYGVQSSAPVNSAGVRALISPAPVFLSATNTGTFDISIPATTQEVYFFIPENKTVVVQYVESSFADVTGSFITTDISVNDAGSTPQAYESWVSYIGVSGYPSTATYRVTLS